MAAVNFPNNPTAGQSHTDGGRTWTFNGVGWVLGYTAATAGGDLTGTYPNPTIATGAVTSAKILDGTIATADLADAAVTSAKIADGAVVTADLANSAVSTAKIADDAVTSAKIADGTIVNADISSSASIAYTKMALTPYAELRRSSNLTIPDNSFTNLTDSTKWTDVSFDNGSAPPGPPSPALQPGRSHSVAPVCGRCPCLLLGAITQTAGVPALCIGTNSLGFRRPKTSTTPGSAHFSG